MSAKKLRIIDAKFVCEVPEKLGIVTKLCQLPSGRMYARITSGVLFIVPEVKQNASSS